MTVITKIPWPTDVATHVANANTPSHMAKRTVTGVIATWRKRRANRRVMANLAHHQPDSVLADAHISRAEALRESRKPFWRP